MTPPCVPANPAPSFPPRALKESPAPHTTHTLSSINSTLKPISDTPRSSPSHHSPNHTPASDPSRSSPPLFPPLPQTPHPPPPSQPWICERPSLAAATYLCPSLGQPAAAPLVAAPPPAARLRRGSGSAPRHKAREGGTLSGRAGGAGGDPARPRRRGRGGRKTGQGRRARAGPGTGRGLPEGGGWARHGDRRTEGSEPGGRRGRRARCPRRQGPVGPHRAQGSSFARGGKVKRAPTLASGKAYASGRPLPSEGPWAGLRSSPRAVKRTGGGLGAGPAGECGA